MCRHAVRDAQRPRQHRPFVLFDLHQVLVYQGSARRETAPCIGAARWQTAQLEPESDAGAAPGDVILQIAVEALEARVDVRGHRDQEQLDVDFVQIEGAGQAAQPKVGTDLLGGVSRGLGLVARLRCARVGWRRDRFVRE